MLMNDKIMFDHYYCINSANHCKNEENIGSLNFITLLHFYAPNFEKVGGHIGFGLSVCMYVFMFEISS